MATENISDPVNIAWYKRKIDVSIFINGKWTSRIPYVYTNNTWVKSKAVLCELNMIYYITYNLDGGILPDDAKKEYYEYDGLSSLPTPTKNGYTFLGWYESSDFSGSAVTSIPAGSTEDKVLYANWIEQPVLTTGLKFNKAIPTTTTAIVFTDEVAPSDATLIDVSSKNNSSIVGWLDGTTFKVSPQMMFFSNTYLIESKNSYE